LADKNEKSELDQIAELFVKHDVVRNEEKLRQDGMS